MSKSLHSPSWFPMRTMGCWLCNALVISFLAGTPASYAGNDDKTSFQVVQTKPANGDRDVELDPVIQIHVSHPFEAKSLDGRAIALVDDRGDPVPVHISGDLGGVITLSTDELLRVGSEYRIRVTAALRSRSGAPIRPVEIGFRTVSRQPISSRERRSGFEFQKHRVDHRDGVVGLAIVPGKLFACTWDGRLIQYRLNPDGTVVDDPGVIWELQRRFNAIVADPRSNESKTVLWLCHDSQQRLSLGPNDFSGTVSRITITDEGTDVRDMLTGLPTGDHPASGLVFGPDGRLFVSQGALSMLGGKASLPETPLSAATLAVDLQHPSLNRATALDVRDYGADTRLPAVEVFATGIREAFDLCWHSNGHLYAGVNMNDTAESTPTREGLPAVNVRPAEMMLRIVQGKYYGHPNPSRDEWVLLGGNPTAEADPWEIDSLPVGTLPDPNFDASLFIRNLEQDKGPSANGVCEWKAAGVLQGRLLFCFYTATRGIHSYELSADGSRVTDHQPLVDAAGRPLRFGAPLDIVFDSRGWLYVADFGAAERGDSGKNGGVWLVRPQAR